MRSRTNLRLAMVVFLAVYLCSTVTGKTIYVDKDSPGLFHNGTNWVKAFKNLQDALALAFYNDEIRVAEGTYKPDQGGGQIPGNRTATFELLKGVAIYGGYAGYGQPDPNARDPNIYETILSGDLDSNDVPVPDPCDLLDHPNRQENAYHVVTGSNTNETALLDGFTAKAGNANGDYPHSRGGGMYNDEGSPTVTNCTFNGNSANRGGGMYNDHSSPTVTGCTFIGNSAYGDGGGMFNLAHSSPTVSNCTFSVNSADDDGGGMFSDSSPTVTNCIFSGNSADDYDGGGMANLLECDPTVTNCTFSSNSARRGGGMATCLDSEVTVTNCTFSSNSASEWGGGMYNYENGEPIVINCTFNGNSAVFGGGMYNEDRMEPTLTNCTFSGNSAGWTGGGIYNEYDCNLDIINCTFCGNSANNGNGIACDSRFQIPSTVNVINCILWDGGDEIWNNNDSVITVSYSDIFGGWSGPGGNDIDSDPLFADADGPDDIVGTEDDNLRLSVGSPCIDAGDNAVVSEVNDLAGRDRIVDGDCNDTEIVDMGAYEFGWAYIGDFEGEDCDVDFFDYSIFASAWLTEDGEPGYNPDFDIGIPADDYIDMFDLEVFVDNWLAGI